MPGNRGKNTTLIAALSLSGMGAAMILEGSADTIAFEVYEALGQALLTITAQDAQGWFHHCGYILPQERKS